MADGITGAAREAQRVAHLVLGQPRPKPAVPQRPEGLSKQEWKALRRIILSTPVRLAPDIERGVALREAFSRGKATPETQAHAEAERSREGTLARLCRTGAIDAHQLAAAEEIRAAHGELIADVAVRTARWERTSRSPRDGTFESAAAWRRQRAYSAWREAAGALAPMLLAVIVDDLALTRAARRWRLSDRRARAALSDALDRWRRG